jgi:hypothetical protein
VAAGTGTPDELNQWLVDFSPLFHARCLIERRKRLIGRKYFCHCVPLIRHCALSLSLRAPTRNPGLAWHWIPDRVRDDKVGAGMTKPGRDGNWVVIANAVKQAMSPQNNLPIKRFWRSIKPHPAKSGLC